MKKVFLSAFLFLLTNSFQPFARAQEKVIVEPMLVQDQSRAFVRSEAGEEQFVTRPGRIFTEGGNYEGIALPYLISAPKPVVYPRWAVRQGWQGRFVIALEVLTDGTVGRYYVMRSTGHRMLDHAALRAVRTWKFHPAVRDGKAVVECVQIPVVFKLDQE